MKLNWQYFVKKQSEILLKVTPFSKYFALTLFICLPFLGGWVGYQFAPEKIVTEKILLREKKERPLIKSLDETNVCCVEAYADGSVRGPVFEILSELMHKAADRSLSRFIDTGTFEWRTNSGITQAYGYVLEVSTDSSETSYQFFSEVLDMFRQQHEFEEALQNAAGGPNGISSGFVNSHENIVCLIEYRSTGHTVQVSCSKAPQCV